MDTKEENVKKFVVSLLSSIPSLKSDEEQVDFAVDQIQNFILSIPLDDEPNTRNFAISPDQLEGVIEGEVYLCQMLNFITATKNEARTPLTLKQFMDRNLQVIEYEIRASG